MTNIAEISLCQQSSYGQNYDFASSHGHEGWTINRAGAEELTPSNCGV